MLTHLVVHTANEGVTPAGIVSIATLQCLDLRTPSSFLDAPTRRALRARGVVLMRFGAPLPTPGTTGANQ